MILIMMGVSGSGKTTVGKALAADLGWPFYDADDFHPPHNVAKMAQGIPLTDADRTPWLARLRDLIAGLLAEGRSAAIACSALKQAYRNQLRVDPDQVRFVYLKGDYETIRRRMEARSDHYMHAEMLRSQFDALEEPTDALTVAVDQPPERIVAQIEQALGLHP